MNSVLVTGGTGHLGNVLIRALHQQGERVKALILPGEDTSSFESLPVEWVPGNVLDIDSLKKAMEGVDYVYHLAGIVNVARGNRRILEAVNVGGTRNVLRACREQGVKRLVYTSSIHALADMPHGITIDEKIPISPEKAMGSYGKSKARATLEVLAAAREGLDAVVVCPTGVIGPYDFKQSAMGRLLGFLLGRTFLPVPVGTYNFVDVRDIADGEIKACRRGKSGEVYLLGGEQVSVGEYGKIVSYYTGKKVHLSYLPGWLCKVGAFFNEVFHYRSRSMPIFTLEALEILQSNCRVCCRKAEKVLGFRHRPLGDTVRDTILWFKQYGEKGTTV